MRALDDAGLPPETLSLREPSLDDVFRTLTGRSAQQPAGEADRPDSPQEDA